MHITFVDLEKAFDNVEWSQLFKMLKEDFKYKDRRLIWSLYKEETAVVRCGEHQQEAITSMGVRQDCSLSPILLNGYIQKEREEKNWGRMVE